MSFPYKNPSYAVSLDSIASPGETGPEIRLCIPEHEDKVRGAKLIRWVISTLAPDLRNLPTLQNLYVVELKRDISLLLSSSAKDSLGRPRFWHSVIAMKKDTDDHKCGLLTYIATEPIEGDPRQQYEITSVKVTDDSLDPIQQAHVISELINSLFRHVHDVDTPAFTTVYHKIPRSSKPPAWLKSHGFQIRSSDIAPESGQSSTEVEVDTYVSF